LEPLQVGAARVQEVEARRREVLAYHPDHLHRGEVGGRGGEEGRRPAEHILRPPERGLHRVQRNTADDEEGHQREQGRGNREQERHERADTGVSSLSVCPTEARGSGRRVEITLPPSRLPLPCSPPG